MSPKRLLRASWWKRPENVRLAASLVAAGCGIALAVWALTIAQGAQGDNRRDIRDTTAAVLLSCQTTNRTRPQIQVNAMVGIDGILKLNPALGIDVRRRVAAAQVQALEAELQPGRSIGFRDCNANARIDRRDFLPDETPPDGWRSGVPELLGADGLPHVKETP